MPLSDNKLTLEAACGDRDLLSLWGGVFYHPTFVDSAASALDLSGCSRHIYIDRLKGFSNILLHKRPVIKVATLPLMFQYFGRLLFRSDNSVLSGRRAVFNVPGEIDYAYLSLPPETDITEIPSNWRIIPQITIALDRKGLRFWGNAFKDDVKNKIRKAVREKVRIVKDTNFPRTLWEIAYERKSVRTPIESSYLERWCDNLMAASILTIYTAFVGEKPVAFRGQLVFGEYAYDWIAGSDPAYHRTGANQLLMAEIGSEISKLNVAAWDLVGGQVKSIAEFKRSFGGVDITHNHVAAALTLKGKAFALARNLKYKAGKNA